MGDLFANTIKHPEAFAAWVAFAAIIGGVAGNWLSARIQAASGRAQADAAKEAARITAEAERLAALRDERRDAVASLIRLSREAVNESERLYQGTDDGHVKTALDELRHAYAVLELMAPAPLIGLGKDVLTSVEKITELAYARGPAEAAHRILASLTLDDPDYRMAQLALSGLEAFRTAVFTPDGEDPMGWHESVSIAIREVPRMDDRQVLLLLDEFAFNPAPVAEARQERVEKHARALRAFIEAARTMLGTDGA
ncbi:hypothetical protein PV350_41225 [Streptomyces sp. PA03-6a]|nr:hypothetical protein [Streptomyces sp. PA03-6a]